MFSLQLQNRIEEEYQRRMKLLTGIRQQVADKLSGCTDQEQVCMKFFYATMPLRDAGEYEFEVFLSYVRHGLFLRRESVWCKELPEDLFLHYVLYYRINSEDISECRDFFYHELSDRIKGLSLEEAVLEINYWCAEHVTYEASDERTISPLTAYRSGTGRCGEESTFTVSALRSVGIAARQVYTPRWAHCDDNHAWVEVLTQSGWQFLGACEPEECLNKGWFTGASGRALIIHSRYFGTMMPETGEEKLGNDGILHYLNATSRYAECRRLTVCVTDEAGNVVPDASVSFEIVNMAEYYPVAVLKTGADGEVSIFIGKGDLLVQAGCEGRIGSRFVSGEEETVQISLNYRAEQYETAPEYAEGEWVSRKFRAPKGTDRNKVCYTKEQKEKQKQKFGEAKRRREQELADVQSQYKEWVNTEAEPMLRKAHRNGGELISYLNKEYLNKSGRERGLTMLKNLSVKDYKDVSAVLLEAHDQAANPYSGLEGFEEAIRCPRIDLEELVAYRALILDHFSEAEQEKIRKNPEAFYLRCHKELQYLEEEEYDTLIATPAGSLKTGYASKRSRDILFVAVCRTLGIPTVLSPVDRLPRRLREGSWQRVVYGKDTGEKPEAATLRLKGNGEFKWKYAQDWTLGQLTAGGFTTLDYSGEEAEGRELSLPEGVYRLLVTNRLPDGGQHTAERIFRLQKGEQKEISLTLPEVTMEEMTVSFELPEFTLTDPDGCSFQASDLFSHEKTVVAFLEEGKEPTEHVLNEMLEQAEVLSDKAIYFVLREGALQNTTLRKVLTLLPHIKCYYGDFEADVEPLARALYVDPDRLPLLIIIQNKSIGIYGSSGYNVGSITMITKLI